MKSSNSEKFAELLSELNKLVIFGAFNVSVHYPNIQNLIINTIERLNTSDQEIIIGKLSEEYPEYVLDCSCSCEEHNNCSGLCMDDECNCNCDDHKNCDDSCKECDCDV